MNPIIIDTDRIHLEVKPIEPDSDGARWARVDMFKRSGGARGVGELLKFLEFDAMPVTELRRLGRQIRTACDVMEEKHEH